MRIIGVLLIIVGVVGIWAGTQAFGDIGISALLSGIGFMIAAGKMKK